MLAGDFFSIKSLQEEAGILRAALEINRSHRIFEGHFPGQPVVPGVCMLQMVKEILEASLSKPVALVSAGQLKFLSIIDPGRVSGLNAEIKYKIDTNGSIVIQASLLTESTIYFKMNGIFQRVEHLS